MAVGLILWVVVAFGAAACPYDDDLVLENLTINGSETFGACLTITAGPGVTVSATGTATLRAGERIVLRPGFRVQAGGRLQVRVGETFLRLTGKWIGDYTWECSETNKGKTRVLLEIYDNSSQPAFYIEGSVSYYGAATSINGVRGINPIYNEFGMEGLEPDPSGRFLLIDWGSTDQFNNNTLSGELDSDGNKITGTVLNGEGCSAPWGPSGTITLYRQTGSLNDTGIDWCANDTTNDLPCPVIGFPGQDGDHGRDALARAGTLPKVGGGNAGFDFTKLDADGNTLPASASSWSCVRDNHTDLIWEVKTTDGGLHDRNHTYTWYDPNSPDGNPGVENGGTCTGSACDTTGFVQAVNQQGLCGASDWRMPTRRELQGIVDYGRFSPMIDTEYFPNTPSSRFWSASPNASHSSDSWSVIFYHGYAHYFPRSNGFRVRLVRGGP